MKKTILVLSTLLIAALGVKAQEITEENIPEIGEFIELYLLDSTAVSYEDSTGLNAFWDYSFLEGYDSESRIVKVLDKSDTPLDSVYPTATHAIDIEDYLTTYTSYSENGMNGHGYVFEEPSRGTVVVSFEENTARYYDYPLSFGDTIQDEYGGYARFLLQGNLTSINLNGELTASLDGIGTLKLTSNEYTNVHRYKLEEYGVASIFFFDLELTRIQYEYYDYTISNLPIFIHSSVVLRDIDSSIAPYAEVQLVVGYDDPSYLNVSEEKLSEISVYPNPAENTLNIQLPENSDKIKIEMKDALGRVVYTSDISSEMKSIDVSDYTAGVYYLTFLYGSEQKTEKVIVK